MELLSLKRIIFKKAINVQKWFWAKKTNGLLSIYIPMGVDIVVNKTLQIFTKKFNRDESKTKYHIHTI